MFGSLLFTLSFAKNKLIASLSYRMPQLNLHGKRIAGPVHTMSRSKKVRVDESEEDGIDITSEPLNKKCPECKKPEVDCVCDAQDDDMDFIDDESDGEPDEDEEGTALVVACVQKGIPVEFLMETLPTIEEPKEEQEPVIYLLNEVQKRWSEMQTAGAEVQKCLSKLRLKVKK